METTKEQKEPSHDLFFAGLVAECNFLINSPINYVLFQYFYSLDTTLELIEVVFAQSRFTHVLKIPSDNYA